MIERSRVPIPAGAAGEFLAIHSCRITREHSESAWERRIVLYKSNQQQQDIEKLVKGSPICQEHQHLHSITKIPCFCSRYTALQRYPVSVLITQHYKDTLFLFLLHSITKIPSYCSHYTALQRYPVTVHVIQHYKDTLLLFSLYSITKIPCYCSCYTALQRYPLTVLATQHYKDTLLLFSLYSIKKIPCFCSPVTPVDDLDPISRSQRMKCKVVYL